MARYKPYDVNQVTLIPVSFPDQILPGSFEYALNEIVDEHIDLRPFEGRYQNDETGCLAYDPAKPSYARIVVVVWIFFRAGLLPHSGKSSCKKLEQRRGKEASGGA